MSQIQVLTKAEGKDAYLITCLLTGEQVQSLKKALGNCLDKHSQDFHAELNRLTSVHSELASKSVPLEEAVEAWVKKCQALLNEYYKDQPKSLPKPILEINPGKRYIKIVSLCSGRSVWAFVDQNGDVLKPASWAAPAKHARGNVYDEHGGMKHIGPYGPAYLK